MAERVQVIIDAKDNASGVLRGLTAQMGALGGAVEHLTGTSINWGNVAQQAARMVVDALQDAFKVATEYASSVRDLSLASGTTAEEASRLLQVLDDFEIKANDVTTATKALTKNGLAPTIETIAQLSDQYLALNTAEERNAFITDNLGRGGAKWANVLKEGGANIRNLNEGVNQSLILNDEQIRQYEEMRLNQDEFNDNIMAIKISLVNSLVPAINDSIHAFNEFQDAQTSIEAQGVSPYIAHRMAIAGITTTAESAVDAQQGLSEAMALSGDSAEVSSDKLSGLLTLTQRLNDATREQIKMAGYTQLKDQLGADGIISPEDAELLNQAGVALGIFDQHAVNSAASVTEFTDALVAGNVTLERYVQLLNSIPTSIDVQIRQTTVNSTQGSIAAGNQASLNAGSGDEPPDPERSGGGKTTGATVQNFWGNNTLVLDTGSGFMESR